MSLRRIHGTELELFVAVESTPDEAPISLPSDWQNEHLLQAIAPEYRGLGHFLRCGSRFYMDVGQHPEITTAEEDNAKDLVAAELAVEAIAVDSLQRMAASKGSKIYINRRVAGADSGACGYHENYSCSRSIYGRPDTLAILGLHVVTRTIYAGAGMLDGKGDFVIAQKASQVTAGVDSGTTNVKPVINSRDEPHADAARLGRIHVVSGDPALSPWTTWMRAGTTDIVLDMIENGFAPRLPYVANESLAGIARSVATDLTLRQPVRLAEGRRMTPRQVQLEFCRAALAMSRQIDLGEQKRAVMSEWVRTLVDLERGPEGIIDRADYPLLLRAHEEYQSRHSLPKMSPQRFAFDYRWNLLGAGSIAERLRQGRWRQWMPDPDLVESRKYAGSPSTRASLRSRIIDYALSPAGLSRGRAAKVDWKCAEFPVPGNPTPQTYPMLDPFASSNEVIDAIIAERAA